MSAGAAEARRRRAIENLEILDSEAEEGFDRLVHLAASRFASPVALISLIESDRQWFKARVGFDRQQTPLSDAFCVHAIQQGDVMVVPDARLDPRFVDNPLVTEAGGVRFYAGAPLTLACGVRVGTLCIIDHQPRHDFSARDRKDLAAFAAIATDQMEQRAASRRHATMEARYREIVDSAAAGIVVVDSDGGIVSANPATEAIFDRSRQALLGAPIRVLLPDLAEPAANDCPEGQTSGERRGLKGDGSDVPIDLLVTRWQDSRGRRFATLVMRDLTARKAAEQAVAASQRETERARAAADLAHARLEDAVEVLPGGFGLFDAEDRLVVCNARVRSIYATVSHLLMPGTTYEELLRAGVEGRLFELPEDVEPEAWIQRRLAYHRDPTGYDDVKLEGGRWIRFEDRVTRDGGRVGVRIDVTVSKRREESFQMLFAGNPVPMWLQDPHSGRIVDVNDMAITAYGYDRQTFTAMSVSDLEEPPGDGVPSGNHCHRRADGSRMEVEIVHSGIVFEDRDLVLCGLLDVTARNRAEASLRLARDSAEEASRMKSQFLANMSHELRTPLNAILGFAQLLESGIAGALSERGQSYVNYIDGSGKHLLSIIEDVLDLSRFEAGHLKLKEEIVDLTDTIVVATELVRNTAVDRGIVIGFDLPNEPLFVRGDGFRLKQIVSNLLSNAVKFSLPNGVVSIALAETGSGDVTLSVGDTGIGMRAEDVGVALEPFMQIEGGLDRRFEGCGIGLPLTRSLVELHQGALAIKSAPGEGTTVDVRLPAARVQQPREKGLERFGAPH